MWIWLLLFFALSFCAFAIQSGDSVMYLALARDFLMQGRWEQVDPYLYSLNQAPLIWIHEYLSHLIFYGAWNALGAPGLILLKICALGAMFWLALRSKPRERDSDLLWTLLWMLAILAGSFRFIERSSMFSDLFMVLLVRWLLERDRIDRGLVVRLSVLFLVWIQLHPGFVAGLIFLGAWAAWHFIRKPEFRTRELWWLLLPVGLLLLNPEGLSGALYPFEFSLHEAKTLRRFNFEWFPATHPAFRFAPEVVSYWVLCLAALVLFIRARAWDSLHMLFALLAFALCLQAVRFMPWSALVILMALKPYSQMKLAFWRSRWLRYSVALVLILVAGRNLTYGYMSSSGLRLAKWDFDPKFFPTKTLEVLKQQPIPGRLYNSHDLGSQLIWAGITPVFHHGFVTDMQFFRDDVMGAMSTQARFLELAAKYNWTMLLVDKYNGYREFHRILSPLPEWKIVAEDEAAYLIYKMPEN
jgi:hypothetical protein